tara:strand:- start:669 stop:6623 length:5955 start_codon:yes stop_codon:yes gene_type:complete
MAETLKSKIFPTTLSQQEYNQRPYTVEELDEARKKLYDTYNRKGVSRDTSVFPSIDIKPRTNQIDTQIKEQPKTDSNIFNYTPAPIKDFATESNQFRDFSQPVTTDLTIQPNDNIDTVANKIETTANLPETKAIKEKSELELLDDDDWFDNAATIYQYEEGKPWTAEYKTKKELGEWFLSKHSRVGNRLSALMATAAEADEFPPEVKQAWLESLGQYDAADPTTRSITRALYYSIADPINIPFLFTGLFAKTGKTAANVIARFNFKKALQKKARESGIKKFTKAQKKNLIRKTRIQQARRAGQAAAGYGFGFGAGHDIAYQDFMSDIDPNYKGYNALSTLTQGVVGGALGLPLGFLGHKVGYKIGDAFKNKNVKIIQETIGDVLKKSASKEVSSMPSTSVYTPESKKALAANQEEGSPDGLRTLYKLQKAGNLTSPKIYKPGDKVVINSKGDTGTIIEYQPKNKQLGIDADKYMINPDKKIIKDTGEATTQQIIMDKNIIDSRNTKQIDGLLFGSGRYNPKTKNIPEENLAKTNFPNINWKSQELSNNKNFKPGAFIKDSEMRKGDKQVVVAQNVIGDLNKEQAYVAIDDIQKSVTKDGYVIISRGKRRTTKPVKESDIPIDNTFDPNTAEKRIIKNGKEYDVTYEEIMKYDPKLEKEIPTGRYQKFSSEVVGVDDKWIQNELTNKFKYVRKSKDGKTFVARFPRTEKKSPEPKGKSFNKEGLIYNPYPNQFDYKNWFTFKSRPIGRAYSKISKYAPLLNKQSSKLFWQRLASSQGLLPDDVYKQYIKKNQAQESIVLEGQKLVDEVNKNTQKGGWKNSKGETWDKWTQVEKDYAAAILNQISMGRRKFFTMAGPERVKYMTQMYKDLSPDMIKYIQEGQGVDLLGNVPPRLIESIKKAWNFKRKIQEEAEESGLIEQGTDLHMEFLTSMGIDVSKMKEKGLSLSLKNKDKRIRIDPENIKEPTDIDLHFNIQYEGLGPDAKGWFKNIKEIYPERIAKMKQLIRTQLESKGVRQKTPRDETDLIEESILDEILNFSQRTLPEEVARLRSSIARPLDVDNRMFTSTIKQKYNQTPKERLDTILDIEVNKILDNFIKKYSEEELPYAQENDALGKVNPFASQSELASIKGTLTKRKLTNEVFKSFLGQYEDPNMNFINTVYKLKQNVENYKYELVVKRAYENGLFDGLTVDAKPFYDSKSGKFFRQTGEETDELVDLGDASTLPEVSGISQPLRPFNKGQRIPLPIERDIMKSVREGNLIAPLEMGGVGQTVMPKLWKFLTGAQGLSRANVTYLTIAGYPRNYVGAGFKAAAAGNWSKASYKEAHKVFKALAGFSNRDLDNEMLKYTDLGIVGTGSRAAELKAILADVIGDPNVMTNMNSFKIATEKKLGQKIPKNMDDFFTESKKYLKAGGKIIGKTNTELLKWYQSMDDVWKIYSYLSEKKRYDAILEEDPSILGYKTIEEPRPSQGVGDNRPPIDKKIPISPNDIKYTVLNAEGKKIPVTYSDDYAAMMVRRHMDNYGEVAQLFKYGRRLPTSDFLAFKVEQVRTTKNIFKTALEDIREGRRRLKESNGKFGSLRVRAGYKRLFSFATVATSGTALATASAVGINELFTSDEIKNRGKYIEVNNQRFMNKYWSPNGPGGLRRVGIPEYNKNSELMQIAPPDKDGNILVINLSRFNPLAEYSNPIRGMLRDIAEGKLPADGDLDTAVKATYQKLKDMFGPSIIAQAIGQALNGEDEYGRKLSQEIDSTAKKIAVRLKQAFFPMIPGSRVYTQGRDLIDYFQQAKDSDEGFAVTKGGFKKIPKAQVINALGGAIELLQPAQSLQFVVQPIIQQMKEARESYDNIFSGYQNPTEDEIIEAYQRALTIEKEKINELSDIMMAAYATGLTRKQIYNAFTVDNTFSKKFTGLLENTSNLSPIYIPSIPPLSEKNQAALRALQIKGKRRPDTINFNRNVLNKLQQIERGFTNSTLDFVYELKKEKQQEED